MVFINNMFILHNFSAVTTFTVYATACDLDRSSLSFDTTITFKIGKHCGEITGKMVDWFACSNRHALSRDPVRITPKSLTTENYSPRASV